LSVVIKKSKSKNIISKIVDGQIEILDPQQICETMNSYFINIGESLSQQLTKTNTSHSVCSINDMKAVQ